jgi:hypothetical protein
MSTRQPDKRRQRPGGVSRESGSRRAVSATTGFLVTVGRVVMLAIMVGAVLRAVQVLIAVIVSPGSLGSAPALQSYVAFSVAAVGLVVMLAIALNSTYLPGRLFAADRLGTLFLVVWACGAVAIVVGLLGSFQLGAYVAIEILPAAVAFVLIGLISPGLFRRPSDDSGTTGHDHGATSSGSRSGPGSSSNSGRSDSGHSGSGSSERGRQRRGGRARR